MLTTKPMIYSQPTLPPTVIMVKVSKVLVYDMTRRSKSLQMIVMGNHLVGTRTGQFRLALVVREPTMMSCVLHHVALY